MSHLATCSDNMKPKGAAALIVCPSGRFPLSSLYGTHKAWMAKTEQNGKIDVHLFFPSGWQGVQSPVSPLFNSVPCPQTIALLQR